VPAQCPRAPNALRRLAAITALTVFLLGQALISGQAPTAAFGKPGVLRDPAAAIGVLVAVVLVLPGIATALPARIESNVEEYWPTMARAQATAVIYGTHELGPWPGFGLMCLFIAAAMAAAFPLLARRDT
jgi:ABC-2 type transport system permease protein